MYSVSIRRTPGQPPRKAYSRKRKLNILIILNKPLYYRSGSMRFVVPRISFQPVSPQSIQAHVWTSRLSWADHNFIGTILGLRSMQPAVQCEHSHKGKANCRPFLPLTLFWLEIVPVFQDCALCYPSPVSPYSMLSRTKRTLGVLFYLDNDPQSIMLLDCV